jgi:hypothetical protein
VPEIPMGLSIDEMVDGFVLRRRGDDGSVVVIPISTQELPVLLETISSWRRRESQPSPPGSQSIQEIVCYPVEKVGLAHEALGERLLLLTLQISTDARRTYALAPHQVHSLIDNMPLYLAEMNSANPTRQ